MKKSEIGQRSIRLQLIAAVLTTKNSESFAGPTAKASGAGCFSPAWSCQLLLPASLLAVGQSCHVYLSAVYIIIIPIANCCLYICLYIMTLSGETFTKIKCPQMCSSICISWIFLQPIQVYAIVFALFGGLCQFGPFAF